MSDLSQGPGWWQASDGKWYSPQQHHTYQAPTAPAPPQMAAAQYGPPPAKKKGGKGCMIALVILLVLMFGGVAAAFVGVKWVGNKIDSGDAFGKTSCDAISDPDASSVLGGNYSSIQLGGITSIAAPVLDSRVLSEGAKTCWIQPAGQGAGRMVRVATSTGGDAAAKFKTEKTKSRGTKEDRGGGLSVESEGYFAKDVQAGDEAFCTTTDVLGYAGVLVRKGNTLTYVSVGGDQIAGSGSQTPTPDQVGKELGGGEEKCDLAMKLAAKTH